MQNRPLIAFIGIVLLRAQEPPTEGRVSAARAGYVLGPADQLTIFVADLEGFEDRTVQIDLRGDVSLPFVGRIHAAGLTPAGLEAEIEKQLSQSQTLNSPQAVVEVHEFHSQPISILGAVNLPGEHQVEGHKTLFAVLAMAGGLRPDAGNVITISRHLAWGRIPLPNAHDDLTGQYSVGSISVRSVVDVTNPAENILIKPEDVISVAKAEIIYCVGAVHKPGGFALGQSDSLSALQVLSLAEGLESNAAPVRARILRPVPGSSVRNEIPLNLKKLLAGKGSDLPLKPDDILFVPSSATRGALIRASEAAIQVATGIVIYGRL